MNTDQTHRQYIAHALNLWIYAFNACLKAFSLDVAQLRWTILNIKNLSQRNHLTHPYKHSQAISESLKYRAYAFI